MSEVWNTKYGPRKVRHDPPTLREAIIAAQGLTSEVEQQAEIAAGFMDVPVEQVRAELARMLPPRNSAHIVAASGREGGARTVIVERKPSRRLAPGLAMARSGSGPKPDPRQGKPQERGTPQQRGPQG